MNPEKLLKNLASLKITITLFALSIILVLAGTLAQMDNSIWVVVDDIFRSYVTRIHFYLFFPRSWELPSLLKNGYIYMPGGFAIGAGLFINLMAAYMIRFKLVKDKKKLIIGSIISIVGLYSIVAINNGIFQEEVTSTVGAAYMRVVWRLAQGLIPSFIMFGACYYLYGKKKAAVVLIHLSVFILLIAEVVTHIDAVESSMTIREGESTSFIENNQNFEIAIIEKTEGTQNLTTVVPLENFSENETLSDPKLPFNITPKKLFKNSDISGRPAATEGVTQGHALTTQIIMNANSDGLSGQKNVPAAILSFEGKNGEDLGTRGFSLYFYSNFTTGQLPDRYEDISVDGKQYRIILRNRRQYLGGNESKSRPVISLIDFSFDRYMGTNTPRNYSSLIRLQDNREGKEIDREVKIWMNNPLRYDGKTFYQQSFSPDEKGTVLQVVKNDGWMLPYISCMMAATGMMIHFLIMLRSFLGKALNKEKNKKQSLSIPQKVFSLVLVLMVLAYFGKGMRKDKIDLDTQYDYNLASSVPVVYKGRTKPLDTVARNFLVYLSETNTFKAEILAEGQKSADIAEADKKFETRPAIQFFLEVISGNLNSHERRVFRITHPQLAEKLGIDPKRKRYRYALNEFSDKITALSEDVKAARSKKAADRDAYETAVVDFEGRLQTYQLIRQAFYIASPRSAQELRQYKAMTDTLKRYNPPLVVMSESDNEWTSLSSSLAAGFAVGKLGKNTEKFAETLIQFANNKPKEFNENLAQFLEVNKTIASTRVEKLNAERVAIETKQKDTNADSSLTENAKRTQLTELSTQLHRLEGTLQTWETAQAKTSFEITFNKLNPFGMYHFYALGFILCAIGWVLRKPWINRCNMHYLSAIALIHTFGLVARIYISGYPPVTNLYATAIFIGWAIVIAALIIEKIFGMGIGNFAAAVCGFTTLLIANALSLDGDTMQMMQAVLDTKFFLMTHVTCISLGYSVMYVAMMAGVVSIGYSLFVRNAENKQVVFKVLDSTIYGTTCFAIFFSFIGTILGGLWADDSWGRFWGWDPKENGALLIVVWAAIVLHAKMAGIIRSRGLALYSLFGAVITTWSWFGVNQLSVGLHSYGFTDSAAMMIIVFSCLMMILIAVGLLPICQWKSVKKSAVETKTE